MCFVVMPISDTTGYAEGHFRRVYEHLLAPACREAGFEPVRADDVQKTNVIVVDILRKILDAEIMLCDMSAKNPNVMYELGIRQAFSRRVVLVKDNSTDRVFDVQSLRTYDYDVSLRVDSVQRDIKRIAAAIKETVEADPTEVNSVMQLVGMKPANVPQAKEMSGDTRVILTTLEEMGRRISGLEAHLPLATQERPKKRRAPEYDLNGSRTVSGNPLFLKGTQIGTLAWIDNNGIVVNGPDGRYVIPPDSDDYAEVSDIPF